MEQSECNSTTVTIQSACVLSRMFENCIGLKYTKEWAMASYFSRRKGDTSPSAPHKNHYFASEDITHLETRRWVWVAASFIFALPFSTSLIVSERCLPFSTHDQCKIRSSKPSVCEIHQYQRLTSRRT
jgi:hypothetical protein